MEICIKKRDEAIFIYLVESQMMILYKSNQCKFIAKKALMTIMSSNTILYYVVQNLDEDEA